MTEATMPVTVEQCDRDAFAALARMQGMRSAAIEAERGDWDRSPQVQSYARHRLNTRATPPVPAGLAGELQEVATVLARRGLTPEFRTVQRAITALTANASQPDRVVDVLRAALEKIRDQDFWSAVDERDEVDGRCAEIAREALSTLDAKDQSND